MRALRRGMRGRLPAIMGIAGLILLVAGIADAATPPAPAGTGAETWVIGMGGSPFSFARRDWVTVAAAGDHDAVRLTRRLVSSWSKPSATFEVRNAWPLADGGILVASGGEGVYEVGPTQTGGTRQVRWRYTSSDDPRLKGAFSAARLANGDTLIADRNGYRVFEVTPDKRTVWSCGTGVASAADGSLTFPFSALRVEDRSNPAYGHTLIADGGNSANKNNGSFRIIEVDGSGRIVWKYGLGRSTTEAGGLASPRWAEMVGSKVYVADAWGFRAMRIDHDTKSIDWQYGTAGVQGVSGGLLAGPAMIHPLPGGTTIVVDTDSQRVLELAADKSIVDQLGQDPFTPAECAPKDPRAALRTPSGTTLIADEGHIRVIEVGYPAVGSVESGDIDFGLAGTDKHLTGLSWIASTPSGTSVELQYSIDGRPWVSAGTSGTYATPSTARGIYVRYRAILRTSDPSHAPTLDSVRIGYERYVPGGGPPGDTTRTPPPSGDTTPPPSGDTTPPPSGGATQTAGQVPPPANGNGAATGRTTPSGTTGGTGSSSGQGAGTGSGSGNGGGSGSPSAVGGTAPAASTPTARRAGAPLSAARGDALLTGLLMRSAGAGTPGGATSGPGSGGPGGNATRGGIIGLAGLTLVWASGVTSVPAGSALGGSAAGGRAASIVGGAGRAASPGRQPRLVPPAPSPSEHPPHEPSTGGEPR